MRSRRLMSSLLSLLACAPPFAHAKGAGGHEVSAAGGIVSPAYDTAVFQNPAGMVFNDGLKATVQTPLDSPITPRAGVLTGSERLSLAAGISRRLESGGSTSAFYGAATNAVGFGAAVGAAGFTDLSSGGTTLNAGVIFGAGDRTPVAVTAVGLEDGVTEWGTGIAFRSDASSGIVLDATADTSLGNLAFQPAIVLGNPGASLTLGYGFGVETGGRQRSNRLGGGAHSRQLSDGFSIGAGAQVGQSTTAEFYYNQLAKFYGAITFGM